MEKIREDSRLQYFWTMVEDQHFEKAIRWLSVSGFPNSRELWILLSKKVHTLNVDLSLYCLANARELPTSNTTCSISLLQVLDSLPQVPTLLSQYDSNTHAIKQEWCPQYLPQDEKDFLWVLPMLLKEKNEALIDEWSTQKKNDSITWSVFSILMEHRSSNNFFDFFCGVYLWNKTWGKLDKQMINAIGKWAIQNKVLERSDFSTGAFFVEILDKDEKIQIADHLVVALYDIEESAFMRELEKTLVAKNREQSERSPIQHLYSILPILDELGMEALDKKITFLVSLAKEFPEEMWIHATLLFETMQAKSIDERQKEAVEESKRLLLNHFPRDPLLLTSCEDEKRRLDTLFELPPSTLKYTELSRLDPENEQIRTMFQFWTASKSHPEQKPFDIVFYKREKKRIHNQDPSLTSVIILTFLLFVGGMWMMITILQTIW